jgi:hypothetical protein
MITTRLAAGEDPFSSPALALRATQLASRRLRRRLAGGLEHALSAEHAPGALTAAIPVDPEAVEIARPVLEELVEVLRAPERVGVRGVALTQLLLTEPGSPLYASAYPEELYEQAREALSAL